jgi:hypothetical protein
MERDSSTKPMNDALIDFRTIQVNDAKVRGK